MKKSPLRQTTSYGGFLDVLVGYVSPCDVDMLGRRAYIGMQSIQFASYEDYRFGRDHFNFHGQVAIHILARYKSISFSYFVCNGGILSSHYTGVNIYLQWGNTQFLLHWYIPAMGEYLVLTTLLYTCNGGILSSYYTVIYLQWENTQFLLHWC